MNFKNNKIALQQNFGASYLETSFFSSSLLIFPNEILLMIFEVIDDIPTLINLSSVCKRFKNVANNCLKHAFKSKNVGLRLFFEQERRLFFTVNFFFDSVDEKTGNFIFRPKQAKPFKFHNSSVTSNPTLWQIIPSLDGDNKSSYPFNHNLLQKSCKLSIKTPNRTYQKIKEVYRRSHLKVPYSFSYFIESSLKYEKKCGNERWIAPISFECPTSFFYPKETNLQRIMNSIINKSSTTQRTIIRERDPQLNVQTNMDFLIIIQRHPEAREKKLLFKWTHGARG